MYERKDDEPFVGEIYIKENGEFKKVDRGYLITFKNEGEGIHAVIRRNANIAELLIAKHIIDGDYQNEKEARPDNFKDLLSAVEKQLEYDDKQYKELHGEIASGDFNALMKEAISIMKKNKLEGDK
ncbi:hypothetical protein vBCtySFA88_00057 [Clostridium phage vB_CtyS-FA88]|nr:hypothetical protein vBCtySFA88_00057 [Clostridium phage vB_CtyS-FA88]